MCYIVGCSERTTILLRSRVLNYPFKKGVCDAYEQELQIWFSNGWLIQYPGKKLGTFKSLEPLITVVQHKRGKVHPIMDYYELKLMRSLRPCDSEANKEQMWPFLDL